MKSYVAYVQSLYDSVLADIGMKYPGLRKELSRDFVRLCSCLKSDGLPFFTITLPEAGKHFDKCLSASRLTKFGLAHLRPYRRRGVIPRLFRGLLLQVFEESGELRVDADPHIVRSLRQVFYLFKKIELECEDARTFGAIREFFEVDRECRSPSLRWDEDELEPERAKALSFDDLYDHRASDPTLFELPPDKTGSVEQVDTLLACANSLGRLQKVADLVSALIGVFDPYEWQAKHGPGAVSDCPQRKSKYDFPTWPRKLDNFFPLADFGFANFGHWAEAISDGSIIDRFSVHEAPSKLIAVPKTQKTPRLIASEPVAHQWCQQIILSFLQKRVSTTFISKSIHFRDQTFNQKAALRASHTDEQMTIDLSAASDRISCWTIERLFRRNESLLRALHASRTRWIVNPIDKRSPSASRLRKFSCMGSACTFPVQTILFYVIAVSAVLAARNLKVNYRNISAVSGEVLIFGDDIIIPKDAGECLDLLSTLGLKVNHSKSFRNGRFRESCGCDAFSGHDVTPVYIKSNPDKARPGSIISAVETFNNLVRGGLMLTANRMKTTIMAAMPHLRLQSLPVDSGYFGWKTPDYKFDETPLKWRFNRNLFREEVLVHSVRNKRERLPDRYGSRVFQYFTEKPPSDLEWVSGIPLKTKSSLRLRWEPTTP